MKPADRLHILRTSLELSGWTVDYERYAGADEEDAVPCYEQVIRIRETPITVGLFDEKWLVLKEVDDQHIHGVVVSDDMGVIQKLREMQDAE